MNHPHLFYIHLYEYSRLAIQRRRIDCVTNNGSVVDNQHCDFGVMPEKVRRDSHPCHATWATGPWSKVGINSNVGLLLLEVRVLEKLRILIVFFFCRKRIHG